MAFAKISYLLSYVIADWTNDVSSIEGRTRFLGTFIGQAALMVIGIVCTTFLPETMHKPLEEIADDDEVASSKNS